MKRLLLSVFALSGCVMAGIAGAQSMPNFDPSKMPSQADMQNMMQKAQEMQQCMAKIDKAELERLEERGNAMNDELERLCRAGREDDALAKAMDFSREMRTAPVVKQAQACAKDLPEMLAAMPFEQMAEQYADATEAEDDFCASFL